MITFLFAGHETTSGLLSFTFYYLLRNPAAYARARREVDDVIGRDGVTHSHLTRLPYLTAVLRESLRLSPTVPAIALAATEDTILGGKHQVKANAPIIALLASVHRDPLVYGEDADEFRPDRMLDSNFEERNKQFPNCWKPFGNGIRGCIGRFFAWQQALLVTTMLLQTFDLTFSDPSYRLRRVQTTITMKPEGFRMRARLRPDIALSSLEQPLPSTTVCDTKTTSTGSEHCSGEPSNIVIDVYYGSNRTCEQLASQLASRAVECGFAVETIGALNSATNHLSRRNPIAIIAASYNGQPSSNAAEFVAWLQTLGCDRLAGVTFAVFGCGHHDWAATFLKIPKHLDRVLEERGATRLASLGTTDVANSTVATDFAAWEDVFLSAVRKRYHDTDVLRACDLEAAVQAQVCIPEATALRRGLVRARVVACETLSCDGLSVKKHMEIALPQDMPYRTGDCLVILPQNSRDVVRRALQVLGLSKDSVLRISGAAPTTLPLQAPIRAVEVLREYVELEQTASKRNVLDIAKATDDKTSSAELNRLAGEAHHQEVVAKRLSLLDLLEQFPAVKLSPGAFLSMQPPMSTRAYCISSSPLWKASCATLTYSATDKSATHACPQPSRVGSAYLSSLVAGDKVFVRVAECADGFRMPEADDNIPLILIAAGTGIGLHVILVLLVLTVEAGIAPFRSIVQERAAQLATGRILADALLFYGCRSRTDDLYFDTFQRWQNLGAVAVHRAYSSMPGDSKECRYVQERLSQDRTAVAKLLASGARVVVCVPERAAADVKEILVDIAKEIGGSRTRRTAPKGQCNKIEPEIEGFQLEVAWHVWKGVSRIEARGDSKCLEGEGSC